MLKIFSIYDSKVESFSPPFFMKANGEAIRAFTDLANDLQSNVGKYPADFTLFVLGTFNENTSIIESLTAPQSLGLAQEFVRT